MRVLFASILLIIYAGTGYAQEAGYEARKKRLLSHGGQHRLSTGGHHKADQVGIYDIEHLQITLDMRNDRLPAQARFVVDLETQGLIEGALVLLIPYFDADSAIVSIAGEASLAEGFMQDRQSGEILLVLDASIPADVSVEVILTGTIRYDQMCDQALTCVRAGPYQHLASAGWYPLSNEFPTTDRFHISTTLTTSPGWVGNTIGRLQDHSEGPTGEQWNLRTQATTYLPVLTLGQYSEFEGQNGARFMAPQSTQDLHLDTVVEETRAIYESLLGPYPFDHIQVTTITNEAGAGIGAQSNVLIPEDLWLVAPDEDFFRIVREVLSHEIAHQYFFNLVGVTDPEEGWMSEGFAEYCAARASETVSGSKAHIVRNYWGYITGVTAISDAPLFGTDVRLSPASFEITYQKGSAVLAALEASLGTDIFDDVLRNYVERFAHSITTTQEFEQFLMETTEHPDIPLFFEQWIYGKGFPELQISIEGRQAGGSILTLAIEQRLKGGARSQFRGPLPVYIRGGQIPRQVILDLSAPIQTIALQDGQWLDIDPQHTLFRRIRPLPAGDVNLNGLVDGMDLLDVSAALGQTLPNVGWRDQLDCDGNGSISEVDVDEIVDTYGQGWP